MGQFCSGAYTVAKRPALASALEYLREGDVFVVTKPDRLARSTMDLLGIVEGLQKRGVALRILSMGGSAMDTGTPTGRMMLTMLAAVAEFERALMLERQREGIAAAREAGRYKGRVPTAQRQAGAVVAMHAEGAKAAAIAGALGIGRASVFAILKENREAQG